MGLFGANGSNAGAVQRWLCLSLRALQGGMAEREEQAHRIVDERFKAESLVESFRGAEHVEGVHQSGATVSPV